MPPADPTFADGSSSVFPSAVDDWGGVLANDVHTKVTSSRFNQISDAVVNLQNHSLQIVLAGRPERGGLIPDTGTNRPAMLYKVYSVALTGSDTPYKVGLVPGPAFTSSEKALFGGTPLHPNNSVHLWVRKQGGDTILMTAFQAALVGPVVDTSGDSGFYVAIRLVGPDHYGLNIRPATYLFTVLITK